MDRAQLATQICETGRRLYERGLIAATEGNISCRLDDDRVLCTPTMVSKGHMTPTDLCVVDMQGRLLERCCQPQRENRPPNMQAVIRLIEMTMMKIHSAQAQGDRQAAGVDEDDSGEAASQAAI